MRLAPLPFWLLAAAALMLALLVSLRLSVIELGRESVQATHSAPVQVSHGTVKATMAPVIVLPVQAPPVQAPPTQAPQAPTNQQCLYYPNPPSKANVRGGCPAG